MIENRELCGPIDSTVCLTSPAGLSQQQREREMSQSYMQVENISLLSS